MDKYQLAQYLVNLHTLLTAQESAGGIHKSQTLITDYEANWGKLKEAIEKETTDEARNRHDSNVNESRTDPQSNRPRSGIPDRTGAGKDARPTK